MLVLAVVSIDIVLCIMNILPKVCQFLNDYYYAHTSWHRADADVSAIER